MYIHSTYMHTYIHTYIHTHIHTYIHKYIHMYKHTYTYVHTNIPMYSHVYIHTYIHTYILPRCHGGGGRAGEAIPPPPMIFDGFLFVCWFACFWLVSSAVSPVAYNTPTQLWFFLGEKKIFKSIFFFVGVPPPPPPPPLQGYRGYRSSVASRTEAVCPPYKQTPWRRACIHTYIHTYIHLYIHTYMSIHTCTHAHIL